MRRVSTGDTLQSGVTQVGEDDLVTVQGITVYKDPDRVRIGFTSQAPTSVEDTALNSNDLQFQLQQNYPNPFNPSTTISYSVERAGAVELRIYNMLGQMVRTLVQGNKLAGNYSVVWDGQNHFGRHVTSGQYFYRFKTGERQSTRAMILLK